MKLKVSTSLLQSMVARAMKGASMNKMLPLTNLMALEVKDGLFRITTTDSMNYLYVTERGISGDDFYVVVPADLFSKLVSRMTCESVEFELQEDKLLVKGNGNYSIELTLDEEGLPIKFPNPLAKLEDAEPVSVVKLSTLRLILSTAKSALAVDEDIPCYTGYYFGEEVLTTDTYKICSVGVNVFGENILVNPQTMDLVDVLIDEDVEFEIHKNVLVLMTAHAVIYSPLMDCIEDFQVEPIHDLIVQEFPSVCKLAKNDVLRLLDRLVLFVSQYDKNAINLTFTRSGLQVESKRANSVEVIPYKESEKFTNYTCSVDIEMLQSQVKSINGDVFTLHYGVDGSIKFVDGNVIKVVALLDDEE